ncbi:MAG: SprT family zinc-dependent metalloprotease [Trueperaceae bacterium]|nr:SprT family zinc-dependent metalloprotease [Trueperaceae bacterium]
MSTDRRHIEIRGIPVEIVQKDIKNLHVGVYPPDGRVRVAAPLRLDHDGIRLAIISRLRWIKRQRTAFQTQARQSQRDMVTGESHYLFGQRYRLSVTHHEGPPSIAIRGNTTLHLRVRPDTDPSKRREILNRWYRNHLRERIPDLIATWEPTIGVQPAHWGIKRMKTKWGSCNPDAQRIWLNLELAKKPPACLEYVLVHEMVHLRERHHGPRFVAIMDEVMPHWRLRRDELNQGPLAHENWEY